MKLLKKEKRKFRVRKNLKKVANCQHRLTVFVSNSHIYAQIIDDTTHTTVACASTVEKDLRSRLKGANKKSAQMIGELVGRRSAKAGVKKVFYDRSGYKYHGCVKVLADAARENLEF